MKSAVLNSVQLETSSFSEAREMLLCQGLDQFLEVLVKLQLSTWMGFMISVKPM